MNRKSQALIVLWDDGSASISRKDQYGANVYEGIRSASVDRITAFVRSHPHDAYKSLVSPTGLYIYFDDCSKCQHCGSTGEHDFRCIRVMTPEQEELEQNRTDFECEETFDQDWEEAHEEQERRFLNTLNDADFDDAINNRSVMAKFDPDNGGC